MIRLKSLLVESAGEIYYVIDTSDNDIFFVGTLDELKQQMSNIISSRTKWYQIFKTKRVTLNDLIKNKGGVRGIKLIKAKDYDGYKGYTSKTFDSDN